MNWMEKVKYLMEREKNEQINDPYFYDVCFTGNNWTSEEIHDLNQHYPWLPESYLKFIQEFDGISIAFLRFYGSKNGEAISLNETLNEEAKPCLDAGYFPFGRYADGSMFIMNKDGRIFWWDKYDYEFLKEPKWVANSLEEFIDQCVLGSRYGEFAFIEDSKFYPFLKSMNWA